MMDMESFGQGLFSGVVLTVVACALMTWFWSTPDSVWHAEAIERGCAAYDEKTGEWEWTGKK